MKKILLLLLILFSWCSFASPDCNFTISSNNFQGTLKKFQQGMTYSFSIKNSSNSNNCINYRAYFSRGDANSYNRKAFSGNNSIPYNLYSDSSMNTVLKEYGDASSGEFLSGSLPNSGTYYNNSFTVKMVDLNSVFSSPPNHYGDLIEVRFYSIKNNGTETYERSAYIYFSFVVPRYADLSLVSLNSAHDPSQTEYTMDFGTLTSNNIQSASLNIKGNVGFGIYMASQNGSFMKNASSQVPYQIKVGTTNYMSLSNAGQKTYIMQRNSGTSVNAENYPISVQLGTVPNNIATGNYEDVITVTVEAW